MKYTIASLALMLGAAPVLAGNVGTAASEPAVAAAPVVRSSDWTGAYAGLQIDNISDGELLQALAPNDVDGTVYGIFAGYRFDFGQFVLGGEIDYMTGDGDITDPFLVVTPADYDILRIGLEAGVDLGRALVYGTAGYADIDVSAGGATIGSSGHYYGIGIDYLASDRIVIGAELLQHKFDSFSGAAAGSDLDVLTFGVNVALRF